MKNTFHIPELLAPAGSIDKLKTAILYGADAIYLGGPDFSLRAHAVLGRDHLVTAVDYAHQHNVKVYLTANIFAHQEELALAPDYFSFLEQISIDGLIVADPGLFRLAQEHAPKIPLHVSTQANTTNAQSTLFWQNLGARRVNLARELTLREITEVRRQTSLELEIFVHGALCISYSGRCSLSLYLTGRDANRGNCAHPCRYQYQLQEAKRPGQFFPVEEDQHGTYIFNSKDLCLMNRLPQLLSAGADSLKIEGRMKSTYYVGAVVRAYRGALDFLKTVVRKDGLEALNELVMPENFMQELRKVGSRGYTENFAAGPPESEDMLYSGSRIVQTHLPIGVVVNPGTRPQIEARNPFLTGSKAEYMGTNMASHPLTIVGIQSLAGETLERANPGNAVILETSPPLDCWEKHGLLRMKAEDSIVVQNQKTGR